MNIRVNNQIRVPEVRLIKEDGSQLGIVNINDARKIANELNIDLLEIVPDAKPPVVKLQKYDKYIYEQQKKEKEAKKAQKASKINVKELRFRPVTQEHDIQIMVKQGQKFLDKGDRVKLTLVTKGREKEKINEYAKILTNVVTKFGEVNYISEPIISGKQIQCVIELQK